MKKIVTERLIVRQFKRDDWRDLQEYIGEKRVLMYESPWDVSDVSLQNDCDMFSKGRTFWAVEEKESQKMIGHVYFREEEPKHFEHYALGYIFNPKYYGQGYATEAVNAILYYGFEVIGIHRIFARCHPENVSSWKLLERLGFRKEGYFVKSYTIKNDDQGKPIWWDEYAYGLLIDDYRGNEDAEYIE